MFWPPNPPMICGVYAIKNKISGQVYIGASIYIERRWSMHRYHLKAGTHHSRFLQASWNEHGEDAFDFEVLLVVPAGDLITNEQRFIDELKPSFNIHPNAASPLGVKRTAETRRKLSELKKGIQPAHLVEYVQQCIGKPAPWVAECNRSRAGMKRSPHSPEGRANISKAKLGIPNMKNRGIKKPWLAELNRLRRKSSVPLIHP